MIHTLIGIFLVYLAFRAIMRSSAKRAADRDMAKRFVPRPFVFTVPNPMDRALAREAERARWAAYDAVLADRSRLFYPPPPSGRRPPKDYA